MSNSLRILLIVEPRLRKCMVDMLSCSHIFLPEASSKSTNIDRISWSTPSWLSIIFLSCSICVLLSFSMSSLRHLAASSSWTVFWSWFLNSSWDWLSLRLWNKWKKRNNINKAHFHPILLQGVKKIDTESCSTSQAGLELNYRAQAGLELTAVFLSQPPKSWDYMYWIWDCTQH